MRTARFRDDDVAKGGGAALAERARRGCLRPMDRVAERGVGRRLFPPLERPQRRSERHRAAVGDEHLDGVERTGGGHAAAERAALERSGCVGARLVVERRLCVPMHDGQRHGFGPSDDRHELCR